MQTQITIKQAVQNFEDRNLTKFKPTKKFYETTNINSIRFGQLVEGKKQMYASELKALSEFFNVPVTELI